MTSQSNPLRRIRLVYKRSSNLTKAVVLCAVVLSTVTLLTLRWALLDTQAQSDALKDQAAQLEQENDRLEDKNNALGSVDSAMDIAQDELGYVDPDTVFFDAEG